MSETYISLYGEKSDAFERVKDELGPEGVDPSNTEVVMRLIEMWEGESNAVEGGLVR